MAYGTKLACQFTSGRHGADCVKQRNTTMKRMKKGFTLVEIMIVVAIIAILAAIAIPNFVKYRKESQEASCESTRAQIVTAAENWGSKSK